MKTLIEWQKETKVTYKRFSDIIDYEDADRMGYGKTVLIGFSLPFHKRMLKAVNDLIAGIHYRYPICCTVNFCMDTLLDRPSAQLRYSEKTDYVECFAHIRRHGKSTIPLDLY